MKRTDSETLKALKERAEQDPVGATEALLDLVFSPQSDRRRSAASPDPQEA